MTRKQFTSCFDYLNDHPESLIKFISMFPNKKYTFKEHFKVPFSCTFTPNTLEVTYLDSSGGKEFLKKYITNTLEKDDYKVISLYQQDIKKIVVYNNVEHTFKEFK